MFAKIRILIESTPRSKAMPDGTAHFAMSAHKKRSITCPEQPHRSRPYSIASCAMPPD